MTQYETLLENIEKIQNLGYSTEFDISKFLLSEDDIVKKILAIKNTYLTKDQIDMIVDPEDKLMSNIDNLIDNEKGKFSDLMKNVTGSLTSASGNITSNLTGVVTSDDGSITDNLTGGSESIIGSFNINEISERTVDNFRFSDSEISKEEKKSKEEKEKEREESRKAKKEEIKAYKEHYKDKLKELKEEAKKILTEIKDAFFNLLKEMKELIKKAITSLIQTISSMSAVVMIVASPPWNVPLAMSTVVLVIDIILSFINQIKTVIPFLEPLNKLNFVLNDESLATVCSIVNTALIFIIGLFQGFSSLEQFINKLINKIIELIMNKDKIFRKATRKLRKLGYFRNDGKKPDLTDQDEDDLDEIESLLDTYKVDISIEKVVDYKEDVDPSKGLSKLKELLNAESPIPVDYKPEIIMEKVYAYDVLLPDGSVLYGLTEKDIEELKKLYNVVIDQVNKTIDGIKT